MVGFGTYRSRFSLALLSLVYTLTLIFAQFHSKRKHLYLTFLNVATFQRPVGIELGLLQWVTRRYRTKQPSAA